MISQETISSELDLAKRIYLYYLDKYADLMSVGSSSAIKWYKELCQLYFITDAIQAVYIADSELYVGNEIIDDEDWRTMTSLIREFVNYDIRDIVYTELDTDSKVKDYSSPLVPPIIVSYQTFNQNWESQLITIAEDDITEVTVEFDISDVDSDSIRVTVNDNDPVLVVAPEAEGIHFIGTTLYWHTYYNLKTDDVIQIQYLKNNA